jgi:squalene-hopene/tetraprenyl-beta-curcumene cyclase
MKPKTKKRLLGCAVIFALLIVGGYGFVKSQVLPRHSGAVGAVASINDHTGDPYLDAMARSVRRLCSYQETNGAFIKGYLAPQAAITALVAEALGSLPEKFYESQPAELRADLRARIERAQAAILTYAQEDGGIYTAIPGYSYGVYSTAFVMVALRAMGLAPEHPALQNAQAYLLKSQHSEKGLYLGGAGYQPGARPDLNNTVSMLEALEASGLPKDHPAYQNAIAYVSSCQNRSESNTSGIAVTDDGGFFYLNNPEQLKEGGRGTMRLADGNFAYASYGAMSYAGLVSFLYAAIDKDDGRVKSAFKWIQNNYDLHENVGRKNSGLYYYYRIMAKALAAFGERYIETPDGVKHDWARELADQMVSLQNADGSWQAISSGFMENDEVLVGGYGLRTLEICYEEMSKNE